MLIEWSRVEYGKCERVEDVPEGATIEAIDDVPCLGLCEGCSKPILEGDHYGVGVDGEYACLECCGLMEGASG